MKRKSVIRLVMLVSISFLVFVFSNGLYCIPVFTWIYPVLLLMITRKKDMLKSMLIVFFIMLIGFVIQWTKVLGIEFKLFILLAILITLVRIIPYILYKYLRERKSDFIVTIFFPMTLVTIEYIIYLIYPIIAGLSDAYTQYQNLVVVNIISLVGVYGITFIMGWSASVMDWVIGNKFEFKKI